MSSKYNGDERVMHSERGNREFMISDNVDEVTEECFESLLDRYQIWLEASIGGKNFIFDCISLLNYKCH